MSIPPLVCSTPPPPDQCVDDKDHHDFDLSYGLSQDDDDDDDEINGYNYGSYTTYNHFQSAPISDSLKINQNEHNVVDENVECEIPKQITTNYEEVDELKQSLTSHNVIGISDINENKLKSDDDVNIEDLNLHVDDAIEINDESNIEGVVDTEQIVSDLKDLNNQCHSNNDSLTCDITDTSPLEENSLNVCDAPKELNSDHVILETAKSVDLHIEVDTNEKDSVININTRDQVIKESVELEESSNSSRDNEIPVHASTQNIPIPSEIDEFDDDFDDFQSVNAKSGLVEVVENSVNPWENVNTNEAEFENFTATFEEAKFESEPTFVVNDVSSSSKAERTETDTEYIAENNDDDFGDFDEFRSSTTSNDLKESVEPSLPDELPLFNLQLTENENQFMDKITTVLSSVFLEEISEPENDFEGKLESLLSETWGHLMETDERQPYIINWNNSFGQKTLLKALCIDSRNILFGPKWSSNMPKYAANLSNAPLQPQKQESTPSSLVMQTEAATEKPVALPVTWNDPFTSDGQESCNTEKESAVIKSASTDKDVFEPSIPIKPEKIFSNTIGIQPVRQINLPDTHIFTPTDSEIPRSKTIHYDLGSNVLLPTLAGNQIQTDTQSNLNSNSAIENVSEVDKNEYWDFQNFKSSSTNSLPNNLNSNEAILPDNTYSTLTTINALPQPSVAYQIELLQPIKIEPATPTLNWPDPGEVKEVFDDFSDFISISQPPKKEDNSLHTDKQPVETVQPTDITGDLKSRSESNVNEKDLDKEITDDDFETFQSALPAHTADSHSSNLSNQINSSEFVSRASKIDSVKSDTISTTSITRPNDALTKNVGYKNTKELNINKNSLPLTTHIQGNLLQPIPASFGATNVQNNKKSGQILQPLSLESYSQINWPSPGIDLQDLSRFNPVETLHSLKSDLSTNGPNKGASPVHSNQVADDDGWGEFVSSKPKPSLSSQPKKPSSFVDDDEWTDFISSPSVKPQNGLNTISLNVHTNSKVQNSFFKKPNQPPVDIPTLNYVTPKSNQHKSFNEKHFQNL